MKIALTLSGQPRRYQLGYKQLKKWFLDRYDIDVYLHSWITPEVYKYHYGEIQRHYHIENSTYDNLLELYQPKSYLFEEPINFDASNFMSYQGLNSQMGMFMSLKRSWELLEDSGIKYDYIIRARSDLFFDHYNRSDNPLLSNISNLDPNIVHFPRRHNDTDSSRSINDIFAIGGYEVMKVYHNIFPHILNYLFLDTEYDQYHGGDKYFNEALLFWHLKKNNIPLHAYPDYKPLNADGIKILR